jgi:hypothetical protein
MIVLATACGAEGPEPTHRGTYLGGEGNAELNMFTPCGDTTTLWVEGKPQTVERLRKAHQTMTRNQFQPIYIEFRGRVLPPGSTHMGDMYSGIIHVDTVLTRSGRAPMSCAPKGRPPTFDIG